MTAVATGARPSLRNECDPEVVKAMATINSKESVE
jgi:hypothetical protein